MEPQYKIVDFDLYCKDCVHRCLPTNQEPCNSCLEQPVNLNSNKPTKFKARKAGKNVRKSRRTN